MLRTRVTALLCRATVRSSTNYVSLARTRSFHSQSILLKTAATDITSTQYSRIFNPDLKNIDRPLDTFARRHLGPSPSDVKKMLKTMGYSDLNAFIEELVPPNILKRRPLKLEAPNKGFCEQEMLQHLEKIANKNHYKVKNFIGKGYYGTILPPVIQRNLLESPEWYTSYTPYQPEISQGRLEALLNFQTVVSDLTGLPVANASLLDEGTAAGEAMLLSFNISRKKKLKYVIDKKLHQQTKSVLHTRAKPFNIEIIEVDCSDIKKAVDVLKNPDVSGCLVQYPATDGSILPPDSMKQLSDALHSHKSLLSVASDLMALTLLKPPAHYGADIVLGSSQRFGVPMGYGGPHAAFFAVIDKLNRKIPGRIVGISKDRLGKTALRLALQTREQHIKRDKATSNICTAQALLANVASSYCVYHGPKGLQNISRRIFSLTSILANAIENDSCPHELINKTWFDTLTIKLGNGISSEQLLDKALKEFNINLFAVDTTTISLALDETTTKADVENLLKVFDIENSSQFLSEDYSNSFPREFQRTDEILRNEVFHMHHSETAMLRYLHRLQSRDLSLANSMIPLGSCTMKLNSTVEMMPITWPQFSNIHPFQPSNQVQGYKELITSLEKDLCSITGFDGISLQPNSGAQGEYTGLRVIRSYLESKGENHRNVCLIPVSAHGTNPASAAMAGLKVVPVNCLQDGSLDLVDLKNKAEQHSKELAAVMITYPSTYGLFEPGIQHAIDIVHSFGGQVYLDGANMNAQVGLTSPGDLGADVCHLNLHKTFSIPHGGGGPAGAPICVKSHLIPHLPKHDVVDMITGIGGSKSIDSVSSAPYGNALVLPISYAYIKMMGNEGLPFSSVIAMLNSNYMMTRLKDHYKILFVNEMSTLKHCAHEFIVDLREYKAKGVEAIDVAKRLQDYGFHAPTLAFPVPGTLMIEPTESENLEELDRFCDAMISIKEEINALVAGQPKGQILKNAPHSLEDLITSSNWDTRGYTREEAAYPLPFLRYNKFWPTVARLDDTYGDMNLICTCPSVEEIANETE
ncbi:glycine decarboxylase subunit P [Saccharomyces cerevisiae]|nr:ALH_1c_G0042390.mRNA.1.CDS.1 [Saccharomyces cerevisiae]CAI4721810.1 ALH_1b_G0042630.mRNA.1.CDS.1 [Saccharomyces cerevisiae]CAI5288046.1 AKR_HP2_G0039720.mRNA.1.CDS.1 [Saccharomyces cerevisiae]CAI6581174.1 AKR_HP2_G0039720.mRNA.1.CDS.1 [Saccharomyces cerevisiae]CAI6591936.1 AKR_HP1_G0041210.mRNA.1.CDS.1 [Saccharomyces cerevisiae]